MSMDRTLDRLEKLSLLGPGWIQVAEGVAELRGQLQDETTATVLRVILLDAALRSASPQEDPIPFLAQAERWARSERETLGATKLCLAWCENVGRIDPQAVPERVLMKAVAQAQAAGGMEAEWRLALAVGHADDIRLLGEALLLLQAPHHAHRQLQVLLELTTAHLSGGDVPAAITQLEAAGELARSHGADRDSLRVAAMLGQLRLVQGMQRHARPHLEQAVDLAQRLEDDLSLLSNATLLSGIQLGAGEWALAEATAALQLPAAVRRHNWMAVADGAITKSTCALGRGDPPSSVSLLVQCSQQMRGRAPAAAIRLVQARLAELRGTIGDAIFDPLLTSALSPQE